MNAAVRLVARLGVRDHVTRETALAVSYFPSAIQTVPHGSLVS